MIYYCINNHHHNFPKSPSKEARNLFLPWESPSQGTNCCRRRKHIIYSSHPISYFLSLKDASSNHHSLILPLHLSLLIFSLIRHFLQPHPPPSSTPQPWSCGSTSTEVYTYIHTYIIYAYNRYIVLSAYNVVHAFWNTALEMASGFCTRMELYIWVLLYEIFYELGFLILVEFCH